MTRPDWPREHGKFLPHTGYPKGLDAWLRHNEARARQLDRAQRFTCWIVTYGSCILNSDWRAHVARVP